MAGVKKTASFNPERRIARTPAELAAVFAASPLAPIAGGLSFTNYFPRSVAKVGRQRWLWDLGTIVSLTGVAWATGFAAYALRAQNPTYLVLAFVMALLIIRVSRRLMWSKLHARTQELSKFIEILAFWNAAPAIYLRKFSSENPDLPTSLARSDGSIRGSSGPSAEPVENALDATLHTFGPVVGLGDPADASISQRIFRLYSDHSNWQATVRFLLAKARVAFLQYDPSAAVDWELSETLNSQCPLVIVLIPNVDSMARRDKETALASLPAAIRQLNVSWEFRPQTTSKYVGGNPALIVAIEKGQARAYGAQAHFNAVFDVLLKEAIRSSGKEKSKKMFPVPRAYRELAKEAYGKTTNFWLLFQLAWVAANGVGAYFLAERLLRT